MVEDEGLSALSEAEGDDVEMPLEDVKMPEDEARAVLMRAIRPALRELVGAVPSAAVVAYGDKRLRLSDREMQEGLAAWEVALDLLCPDVTKLAKMLVLLSLGCWHFRVYIPRVGLALSIRKREKFARLEARRGGGAAVPAEARHEDERPAGAGDEDGEGGEGGDE